MESSKQEMELFLQTPGLLSKTTFTECFSFDPRGLWLIFETGNRIIQSSKNSFYKMFLIWSEGFKINFWNRKWNYPNRKWNYFSYFPASNPKLLLQNVFHLIQGVRNQFSKQEMELSKQEMELFLQLPSFWSKNFYFQIMKKLSEDGVNMQEGK